MKVYLQDSLSKRYYAGPRRWVESRAEALDFGKVDLAAKAYTEETTDFAEIVVDDGKMGEPVSEKARRAEAKARRAEQARPER
mgnify:CR=1 FL=1